LPVIATAGWSIPKTVAHRFPEEGSGLARYAAVLNGVEINSTFYRRHQKKTFERWAKSVPDGFRFAVKLPREMTHERRLRDIGPLFDTFMEDVLALNEKLGPLLCQLPPSLAFDATEAARSFSAMRNAVTGTIAIEPRHKSWAGEPARDVLQRYGIERVLADPAPVWQISDFPDPPKYVRLHGSPRMYYSAYSDAEIRFYGDRLADDGWCVFDNTASGAAIENALEMLYRRA
jgi:uncharacterized protein YecE (DUF72 family)